VATAILSCLALAACGGGDSQSVVQAHSATPAGSAPGSSGSDAPSDRSPAPGQAVQKVIVDGLPHVRVPRGALRLSDGDADNPGDTDGNGDVDPGADTDEDGRTRASYDAPDADDAFTLELGKGAGPTQTRLLTRLVRRYVAAAGADDAATACTMLLPSEAASVSVGRVRQAGETCRSAAAVLLRRLHRWFSEPARVVDVRIVGEAAEVVLGSRTMPASYVLLKRDAGSWKLDGLLVTRLP
jgi:hypothetical protein